MCLKEHCLTRPGDVISRQFNIGPRNGMAPIRRQANKCKTITWTNTNLLTIGPTDKKLGQIWITINQRKWIWDWFQIVAWKMAAIFTRPHCVNSLWPIDAIWWHRSRSKLVHVNYCWLIINEASWHLAEAIFFSNWSTYRSLRNVRKLHIWEYYVSQGPMNYQFTKVLCSDHNCFWLACQHIENLRQAITWARVIIN